MSELVKRFEVQELAIDGSYITTQYVSLTTIDVYHKPHQKNPRQDRTYKKLPLVRCDYLEIRRKLPNVGSYIEVYRKDGTPFTISRIAED